MLPLVTLVTLQSWHPLTRVCFLAITKRKGKKQDESHGTWQKKNPFSASTKKGHECRAEMRTTQGKKPFLWATEKPNY